VEEYLRRWIARDDDPVEYPGGLPGVLHHITLAWDRRDEPNMTLVHYAGLQADLPGQMRGLAARLGITVPEQAWPGLVQAATFETMRAQADRLVPTAGVFRSNARFFRRGTSGAGREILSPAELAAYEARVARLAPVGMLAWLHAERHA
jgi:hypothetical protein